MYIEYLLLARGVKCPLSDMPPWFGEFPAYLPKSQRHACELQSRTYTGDDGCTTSVWAGKRVARLYLNLVIICTLQTGRGTISNCKSYSANRTSNALYIRARKSSALSFPTRTTRAVVRSQTARGPTALQHRWPSRTQLREIQELSTRVVALRLCRRKRLAGSLLTLLGGTGCIRMRGLPLSEACRHL